MQNVTFSYGMLFLTHVLNNSSLLWFILYKHSRSPKYGIILLPVTDKTVTTTNKKNNQI